MVRPKKVTVNGVEGEFSHFVHKGPKLTFGIVKFKDGRIEEVFHKKIKFN